MFLNVDDVKMIIHRNYLLRAILQPLVIKWIVLTRHKNSEKFNAGTDSILVKGALLVGMYLTLNCNMQMRILSTDLEIMKRTRQLEN